MFVIGTSGQIFIAVMTALFFTYKVIVRRMEKGK